MILKLLTLISVESQLRSGLAMPGVVHQDDQVLQLLILRSKSRQIHGYYFLPNNILFKIRANLSLFFIYFRTFLIKQIGTVSIIQIEIG